MSETSSIRYPFEGRPVAIPRVGLFAYYPEVYLKLVGVNARAAFAEKGLANQHRRLTRLTESDAPSESRTRKVFKEILDVLRPAANITPRVLDDFLAAIDGCAAARERVNSMTYAESLLSGLGHEVDTWKRRHGFLVAMERAGWRAQGLLEAGDMEGAASFMADHPLLQALVWPEALKVLRSAPSLKALNPLTSSMALDAHLGWLAAWDLDYAEEKGVELPHFACLLPSHAQSGRNPTSLFFDALKRRLGVSTVAGILESRDVPPSVDMVTLYRWSAGLQFPDLDKLTTLMAAYGLKDPQDLLHWQFHAAKLVNLMAYLGQRLAALTRESGEPPAMWPWPAYPFGHPDFESWAAERYAFWLAFHREKGGVLAELAKTP